MIDCAGFITDEYPLVIAVFLAGLAGSITHCSTMCSPIVAAQMFELKARQSNQFFMVAYHVGRILTYATLGMLAQGSMRLFIGADLKLIGDVLLVAAGVLFIASALFPQKAKKCCGRNKIQFTPKESGVVLQMLKYFARGILIGFMPCGMLLSALLFVSTVSNASYAFLLMLIFGISTIPAVQAVGIVLMKLGKNYPKVSQNFGRTVMAANGAALCFIGAGVIQLH